jgi:hypothetical protein
MKVLDIPSSGSVNWRTASRNRNGQYIRNRSIPVQPRSTAQRAIRGFLALCSQVWKSVTANDQAAWKTWADGHKRTDSLGQSQAMTGSQAFCSINSFRLLLGLTIVQTPPADPDFSAFVEGVVTSTDGDVLVSTYTRPATGQIAFYVAEPRGAGVKFFGQGLYITTTAGSASTAIDLAPAIAARWGSLPDGCVIQVEQVPWVNGIKGASQIQQVTFAAGT